MDDLKFKAYEAVRSQSAKDVRFLDLRIIMSKHCIDASSRISPEYCVILRFKKKLEAPCEPNTYIALGDYGAARSLLHNRRPLCWRRLDLWYEMRNEIHVGVNILT